jgi:hypothetical protein
MVSTRPNYILEALEESLHVLEMLLLCCRRHHDLIQVAEHFLQSLEHLAISCWKVVPLFRSPKDMQWYSNSPISIMMAVLLILDGHIEF